MSEAYNQHTFRERAMSYASVCGAVAVSMGMLSAETAQAELIVPNAAQQALIDTSMTIAKNEWNMTQSDLVTNDKCAGKLSILLATGGDMSSTSNGHQDAEGLADISPICRIRLDAEMFTEPPTHACLVIKHEYGHIIGMEHVEDPKNVMNETGLGKEYFKYMSDGCAKLNQDVTAPDKPLINAVLGMVGSRISMCRTDVLHKKKRFNSYYCVTKADNLPGQKFYDRITVKSNHPYEVDGVNYDATSDTDSSKKIWEKNKKAGGLVLK